MTASRAQASAILFLFLFSFESALAKLNFALMSDAGEWNDEVIETQKSLLRKNSKRLIMAGDNLYEDSYEEIWDSWKEQGFTFDVVAIGNHGDSYEEEVRYFKMPNEYYSKVYDNSVRFIVLNSDNEDNVSEQMDFLDKELAKAEEPFLFLVYHHPTYTLSRKHDWEERREFQLELRKRIFDYRQKITALIVGHDHLALAAHFNDLPVIMSGAGKNQRKDRPVNNKQDGVQVQTGWFFDGSPYWAELIIDQEKGQAKVDFIRSEDDQIGCSLTLKTGKAAVLGKNCGRKLANRN